MTNGLTASRKPLQRKGLRPICALMKNQWPTGSAATGGTPLPALRHRARCARAALKWLTPCPPGGARSHTGTVPGSKIAIIPVSGYGARGVGFIVATRMGRGAGS